MTVKNTCPAAAIGRRIAALDEKLEAMEQRNLDANKADKVLEARLTGEAIEHIYDEIEGLRLALSHVRATTQDGAAVQIACAQYFSTRHRELPDDEKAQRLKFERAIDRLNYAAIRHLQDRIEADCMNSGVDALASHLHDPWNGVDSTLSAFSEVEGLEGMKEFCDRKHEAVAAE